MLSNIRTLALALLSVCVSLACSKPVAIDYSGPVASWNEVTGARGGGQFSPLTQINRMNVSQLRVAWTYESTDPPEAGEHAVNEGGQTQAVHPSYSVETTPIVVGDQLVFCTPRHAVVALDAESGQERWKFDPQMDPGSAPSHFCRGVASWSDTPLANKQACSQRIFGTSGDGRLFALDAMNGKLCSSFGRGGVVDLRANLGPVKPRELYHTAPPLVVKDLVVMGGSVHDGFRVDVVGGVVRAYDAHTGALVWAWDPVGPGMTPVTAVEANNGKVFTRGTPNVWSFMSVDLEHNLLFLPTGNAAVDFYKGAERPIDYYGTSVVALKIDTGEVAWRFKTVNHDIWDFDVAAQPMLYEHQGKTPAVAVTTKTGNMFLLNRLTGEPIFPVEQRPVPYGEIPEEPVAARQPFPSKPATFARAVTTDDIMGYPIVSRGCKEQYAASRNEGLFTPPSLRGTLQAPGVSGGFNWGSGTIDPNTRTYVGAYLNMPWTVRLVPREPVVSGDDKNLPTDFTQAPQYDTPYEAIRMPFLSQKGIPCIKPPWGELLAVDLDTGTLKWRRPIGSLYGRVPLIGRWLNWGVPVVGGVLQTASGIAFVGATIDEHLRAIDVATGETLWTEHLPFSAHGIPMTYRLRANSKQFLVVATGGGNGIDLRQGDTVVAFALPDR